MKLLFFTSIVFLFFSCGNQKKVAENENIEKVEQVSDQTEEETVVNNFRMVGKVHLTDKGCMVYIDAKGDGDSIKMYPVNLEDKYNVEGMLIRFTYRPSKAKQPKDCDCDMPVIVSDVTRLRQ